MSDTLKNCLDEILTDEKGNKITPECGLEKLLSDMCDVMTPLSNEEIDKITSL